MHGGSTPTGQPTVVAVGTDAEGDEDERDQDHVDDHQGVDAEQGSTSRADLHGATVTVGLQAPGDRQRARSWPAGSMKSTSVDAAVISIATVMPTP